MKKKLFAGLLQNKALFAVIVMSVVLGFGSLAFISLNGLAHSASIEKVVPSPEIENEPAVTLPTQEPTLAVPTQSLQEALSKSKPEKNEGETTSGVYSIVHDTACVLDKSKMQVATVLDAQGTNLLSVSLDGESHLVKLLGIDTQSLNDELSDVVLSANQILVGKTVALVADVLDVDEDDNLLRYVFTEDAFINLALLERGLAVLSKDASSGSCGQAFEIAQETAKVQELGLWERLKPEHWREWPVIPEISENALEIYLTGVEMGTNSMLFSIVGDCQNIPGGSLFRKVNWDDFTLPDELEHLEPTVEHFRSIWSREPVTVDGGFIPASMFSTYWTDIERCDPIETPLECEFRLNNASIVLIGIGSDQKPGTGDDFDHYMREIVEFVIARGALPIIATDAYPTEEGFPLNQIVAQIAYEYDIPMWNFWAAVQNLNNEGLKADNFHISAEAFAVRRLTGLQVLHAVLEAAQQ